MGKQAIQEIDIVSLLNYFTTLMGDQTDLNQFRRPAPPPQPGDQDTEQTAET